MGEELYFVVLVSDSRLELPVQPVHLFLKVVVVVLVVYLDPVLLVHFQLVLLVVVEVVAVL